MYSFIYAWLVIARYYVMYRHKFNSVLTSSSYNMAIYPLAAYIWLGSANVSTEKISGIGIATIENSFIQINVCMVT